MRIVDVVSKNLEDLWRLNQDSVPHVGSVTLDDMHWFADNAHYFRVAWLNGELAGFLIGLRPGLPYDSPNYRWFSHQYRDFGYVDRVAVSRNARRMRVATRLYEDFATTLDRAVDVMTCEVNIRPANDASMLYHTQYGFRKVGTQETEGGKKEVALLELKL